MSTPWPPLRGGSGYTGTDARRANVVLRDAAADAAGKERVMRKLLILAGLGAGVFFAWKRFFAGRKAEDELAEDMYDSAAIHQQADQQPSPSA